MLEVKAEECLISVGRDLGLIHSTSERKISNEMMNVLRLENQNDFSMVSGEKPSMATHVISLLL